MRRNLLAADILQLCHFATVKLLIEQDGGHSRKIEMPAILKKQKRYRATGTAEVWKDAGTFRHVN